MIITAVKNLLSKNHNTKYLVAGTFETFLYSIVDVSVSCYFKSY
jgi:hypothetical protein